MAKPYATEMSRLADTFAWAVAVDIKPLQQAVRTAALSPLLAIGSGGSLTAAHALAGLQQQFAGRIAAVATPLEATGQPVDPSAAIWLVSAGGGNVDILAAARALVAREPRQLAVLCGREDSPLASICRDHLFMDLLAYPSPAGKDGFLATNSLLGFTALLTRAYATEFDCTPDWNAAVTSLQALLSDESEQMAAWQRLTAPLWTRPTTLVLHGPSTRLGAIDLESKFTEAALGNLQLADYRNFAHGRHHWLAKRGEVSAVLALVTNEDRSIAERTLSLLPAEIPQARLDLPVSPTGAALGALIAALRITGWAGIARDIDPGRPHVPEFGRKLYKLPLPRSVRIPRAKGLSEREAAAITRKTGFPAGYLDAKGELDPWRVALNTFQDGLREARFAAVVLDYDGTVVDARCRRALAQQDMATQLSRIAESGVWLAIATGRGVSVRRDLRERLPKALWPRVLVGYYNGAEIATLDDDGTPDGSDGTCGALAPIAAALHSQPELTLCTKQTNRRYQITLETERVMPENRLWDLAHHVVLTIGHANVSITRSSHSVDIVAAGVSKLNVFKKLREVAGSGPILPIGDRGRWPGNDYEMLREDFALSVDEVSIAPDTCWNLAPIGQRGVSVTLDYLSSLEVKGGLLRFASGALR